MYSVVVRAEEYSGPQGELARALAPELGVGERAVEVMLARGPLTVEADLTEPEARMLAKRLQGQGIPCHALGPGHDASRQVPSGQHQRVQLFAQPTMDFMSDLQSAMDQAFEPQAPPEQLASSGTQLMFEAPSRALAGAPRPALEPEPSAPEPLGPAEPTELVFAAPERAPEPEVVPEPEPEREPSSKPTISGWGALFPGMEPDEAPAPQVDLDASPTELWTQAPERPQKTEHHAPEPQESVEPALGSSQTLGAWRDVLPTDAKAPVIPEEPAELGFGATPARRDEPTDRLPVFGAEPAAAPAQAAQPASRGIPEASAPRDVRAPAPLAKPDLMDVFADDGAPYRPQGYDARGPHSASIAMTLSILVPGAGQVFNGQDAEASHYGTFFFLVKPWIDSVRKAREDGQLIEDYKAPRPEDGNFVRAVRYMALWYAIVGIVLYVLSWTAERTVAELNKDTGPSPQEITARYTALDAAAPGLHAAVQAAAVEASAAAEEIPADEHAMSGMSDEERAARLYVIGLEHCRASDYPACLDMMQRVTKLDARQHEAFRLQTWATMCVAGSVSPMPEVEETRTLDEFESDGAAGPDALDKEQNSPVPVDAGADAP